MTEINVIKVVDDNLCSPIAHFEGNGHRLTLMGTLHVGPQSYYNQIANYVADQEAAGTAIHYEYNHPATDTELNLASPRQLADLNTYRQISKIASLFLTKTFNYAYQFNSLVYPMHWQNHDVSDLGMVKLMESSGVRAMARRAQIIQQLDHYNASPETVQWLLQRDLRLTEAGRLQSRLFDLSFPAVAVTRSQTAVQAIEQQRIQQPGRDIVALWGPAYVPRIAKILLAQGYELRSLDWLPAHGVVQPISGRLDQARKFLGHIVNLPSTT